MTTKISNIRIWLNKQIITRVKHLLAVGTAVTFTVVMCVVQFSRINEVRVEDLKQQNFNTCLSKVESRDTIRTLFFGIYDDVEGLFPTSTQAKTFAETGRTRIETLYPSYPPNYCEDAANP